jgi:hypothetical protein
LSLLLCTTFRRIACAVRNAVLADLGADSPGLRRRKFRF